MAKVYHCKCHQQRYTVCPLCDCQYCTISWPTCPRTHWHPNHATTDEERGRRHREMDEARRHRVTHGGETGKAKEATRSRAGESSPAHGEGVPIRYADLPNAPGPGVLLYCRACGSQYSAIKGDYFLCDQDQEIHCGECTADEPLMLARSATRIIPVER